MQKSTEGHPDSAGEPRLDGGASFESFRLGWVVAVGGGVLMALEILASRVLAPHFGSSVYVWGSIISVFLAALSVGYVWGGRLADRDPTLAGLGRQIVLAAVAQGALLLVAKPAVAWLATATGHSNWGTLVATAVLFGLPSVMLGVISPYAVRLKVADVARLGGTVGGLYALSTAGSLAGTLGCTFVLVPYLDLEEGLSLLLALTALTALIAMGNFRGRQLLPSLAAAAMLLLAGRTVLIPAVQGEGLLYEQMTPYQIIQVRDGLGVRTLTSDRTQHSAMDLATGESSLPYAQAASTALLYQPEIGSMLVLGMGGGFAGTQLQRILPDLEVDFVDIDPVMAEVAKRFFRFAEGPRSRVHIQDARRYLDQAERQWDYIYCDTYIGLSVPFHLTTKEFLQEVRSHLAPGGVLGINIAGTYHYPFPRAIYRTVSEVFPHVRTFVVPQSGNLLVLAMTEAPPENAELVARAEQLDARHQLSLPLSEMLKHRMRGAVDLADTPVLLDSYAPVDHLLHMNAKP